MKTAYKFRMYPNKQQEAMLDVTLETCRHLYNTALADRKNCYEMEGISRSYEDQAATLTLEKKEGKWQGVFSQVLQDVLRILGQLCRIHDGFQTYQVMFLHGGFDLFLLFCGKAHLLHDAIDELDLAKTNLKIL